MEQIHATTVICVRRGDQVAVAGDGQVTVGNTVMKHGAASKPMQTEQITITVDKEAAEAYAVLSDPEQRRRYDRFGHAGVSSAAGAAWRLHRGDPVGASIAGAAAILSLGKGESADTGAFSYLFNARNRL